MWEGETPDNDVGVWPENWQAFEVFCAMGSQWRVSAGMAGMVWRGLDYTALPIVEPRMGVKRSERGDLFQRLRIMEAAARTELNRS